MVDHELDDLKREFLAEAEEKAREMQAALEAERTRDSLERLTYLAHQLKGSGGSYGFAKISADAAEIERAVESLVDLESDAGVEERIQQHVISLRSEIDRRIKELAR
ncbi:MAG TPA: Hpt domain-containing protein [Thermoanaerobaculia bacterium]|nr:Hpt domain-containing protein [Thermoanaerobaculia bacterium]